MASVNCREASRILSAALDRALTAAEVEALEYHLPRCIMCRNFQGQLQVLRQVALRFREGDAPGPEGA